MDAILTTGTLTALAAKRATSTVPIIATLIGDPVGVGLVASLTRPGGNVTGLSTQSNDLVGKRIELLLELVPALRRFGVVGQSDNPSSMLEMREVSSTARAIGIEVDFLEMRRVAEIAPAFADINPAVGALYIVPGPFTAANQSRILTFALAARLPTMCGGRFMLDAGGLVSYAANFADIFRRAADYLDKVLRGTKPSDLPVEQPSRFHLAINLTTAKAIRLAIPESFLLRADEVIE